eukprot:2701252-Rhodomonas_salina.5
MLKRYVRDRLVVDVESDQVGQRDRVLAFAFHFVLQVPDFELRGVVSGRRTADVGTGHGVRRA